MATKMYAGITVELTDEGYLIDAKAWTPEIAKEIAKEENIELTDMHLKVIQYIRERQAKGETLTIRSIGKSGITDIKGFYQLFPGAPLKLASKIAGVPKPASCV